MWLTFPAVKMAHELGHAITVKVRGGEVHEMGVMFLLLMPIPYVDASASSAFADKRWRMLVGASGMLTEMAIAAIALFFWVYMEPGVARAVAYNIVLLAGISTLVFNGNPLLRYDGYYILADWLEIPNLAQRAGEYVGYLIQHHLFGVRSLEEPQMARGERAWFLFFAPASLAYRMFVMITIVLVVSTQFYVLGVILALWCVYSMLLMPVGQKLMQMANNSGLRAHRVRVLLITGGLVLTIIIVTCVIRFPSYTPSEGVVWVPPAAQVRAPVDGFVAKVVAVPGSTVHRGDLLIQMEDTELAARRQAISAMVDEMEARYSAALAKDRLQTSIVQEQLSQAHAALDLIDRRIAALSIVSPGEGKFIVEDPVDLPGHFIGRGELVAYVWQAADSVRVVVPQASESLVLTETTRVQIRPAERVDEVIQARIQREVPAATDELPSMALSLQGGGKIGLDPNHPGDNRAIERLFVVDLALPPGEHFDHLGSRVFVRFEHPNEPLARQWYRSARREFMKKFNV
jgi:putative peptide zinc metalloprotease protein